MSQKVKKTEIGREKQKQQEQKKINNSKYNFVIIMSHTSFRVNPQSTVCLNAMELLAGSGCHILNLSDSNKIQTHNHLVSKQALNHLAKLTK